MLVKFKTMHRMGISRWAYRRAVASGVLRPAKTKIGNKYPLFWSADVERAFGLPAGALERPRHISETYNRAMGGG